MLLTDTPSIAFDKVSMDIIGSALDNQKWTLVYTCDTRFPYQIFNGGAIEMNVAQASNVIGNS